MKRTAFIGLVILITVTFPTCTKSVSTVNQYNDSTITSFSQVFEKFWKGINTNYVYWDIDTTNWDALYIKYKPLFEQLDINNKTDIQRSITYFRQMTHTLVDGHFQIVFTKPELSGTLIFPSALRKQAASNFHYSFDYSYIDTSYFDAGYKILFDSTTTEHTNPLKITIAKIKDKMLYFNCNQFYLTNSYLSNKSNSIKPALDSLFNLIGQVPSSFKGMIIDVRNNYGGNVADLNFLVGQLIDKPLHLGYSCYKSNTGRLDFTPWIDSNVLPKVSRAINIPIIVLTDNFTVSLAELVAMAIHQLPNGKIIGETTWGATGPLTGNEVYNAGQFDIPGFLTVYTSSAKFKYIDNKIYEGIGFSPDIMVSYNSQAVSTGRDLPLERAIQEIQ
jgi:hypothetical protein